MNMTLPLPVQAAMSRLTANGFSAYAVGGCVRDALRGFAPHDWDLTTNATPDEMMRCFSDVHVIPTGMQHGTLTVVLSHMPLEITTYRIDGAYLDHRRPNAVTFTHSLTEDLARRDFTINAMAYHPSEGVVDPFGGQADLQAHRIACVGAPDARFQEDGLRILRALRFSSVLDFSIAPQTDAAIHALCPLLHHISAERIWAELCKLLCGTGAERVLTAYADVLFTILPMLRPMQGFDQKNPHHCFDVFQHTCKVVSAVPQMPVLRLAALFHDAGKPHTFSEDERGGHFYRHAVVSTALAKEALHQLKSDRKTADAVLELVAAHDMVFTGEEKQLKRILRRYGEAQTRNLILLHRADVSAQAEAQRATRIAEADALLALLTRIVENNSCVTQKAMCISGHELLAIGIPQGKAIGICLEYLLEQVMDGTLPNERTALCAAATAWQAQHQSTLEG